MNRQFLKVLGGAGGLLLLLAILVVIQVIVRPLSLRKDLTADKLYTLSSGTQSLLASLGRDVTLKLYFSRSMEGVPMPLKQYAQRITDLLREYEANSRGKVVVETLDPKPDSDEEEWAQRYGLQPQGMNLLGEGPQFYLGLVAVSGTHEAAIPYLAQDAEPQIEYLVTRLVSEVEQARRPQIGVLSSLPALGDSFPMYGPGEGRQPWVVMAELKRQYDVIPLGPETVEVPTNLDTVVLIHPKRLSDDALFALDQFVLRGGRLVAFEDPLCLTEQENNPSSMSGLDAESDINRLTQGWGAELIKDSVVADVGCATELSRGQGTVERNPMWLSLRDQRIRRDEVATSPLKLVMFPVAGAFQLISTNGVKATPILTASPDAGLIHSYEALAPGASAFANIRKDSNLVLAVRLQGSFRSAFPEGRPSSPEDREKPKPALSQPVLTKSAKPGVVLLVGDADMLADRFCVRGIGFMGLYQQIDDNVPFALNVIEQLAGNEALLGLRSRGTYDRPFTRVLALQRAAQERWQQQEINLETKLKEAEQRLSDLQSGKAQDQQYILSPEQKKEIEAFRKQMFDTQKELKEVRKNLRREIEGLGFRLKAINILLMPALVAAFGLGHGWCRRRRAVAGGRR